MYEARQNKEASIYRTLSSVQRKSEQHTKHIGALINKSNVNLLQKSIQKKDPEYLDMPANVILSHGSEFNDFIDKKIKSMPKKDKQVPDGPAWFGVNDDFISLLTTIRHSTLKSIAVGQSVHFPIYRYQKKEDKNMMIAKWKTWPEALEYLLYNTENQLYQKIGESAYRNSPKVESKLPAWGGGPHKLRESEFEELEDKNLHWQTKDAAEIIFTLIPAIHAYYLEQDPIIPSSPEYVLKDEAMGNLDEPLKKDITMKRIQKSKYMLQYDDKVVYWKKGIKRQLIKSLDNDSLTINNNDELNMIHYEAAKKIDDEGAIDEYNADNYRNEGAIDEYSADYYRSEALYPPVSADGTSAE